MANFGAENGNDLLTSSGVARHRHFYTEPQLALLEAEFAAEPFPNKNNRRSIAMRLGVSDKSVLWWFQNRRRRVRSQSKSAGNTSTGKTRRHRRRSLYSAYQPEFKQASSGDEWTNNTSSSWPNWSYPSAQIDQPVCYPEEQPVDYSSESMNSPVYPQDWSPITDVTSPGYNSTGWTNVNQDWNNVDTFGVTCYNYPSEFQPQPTYSDWTNWEYTPPFYPTTSSMTTPYYDQQQLNYSAPYCSYSTDSTEYF